MSRRIGLKFFGNRLSNWFRRIRWRKSGASASRRVDPDSDDPYAVLGLPAYPEPDEIHRAYEQLRREYSGEGPKLARIKHAYREICRRQGGVP